MAEPLPCMNLSPLGHVDHSKIQSSSTMFFENSAVVESRAVSAITKVGAKLACAESAGRLVAHKKISEVKIIRWVDITFTRR